MWNNWYLPWVDSFDYDFAASGFLTSKLVWALVIYGVIEVGFAFLVYCYWLPKFQQRRTPPIVRHYEDPDKRHQLFERMLRRQEELCEAFGIPVEPYFTQFIRNWFFVEEEGEEHENTTVYDNDFDNSKEQLACIRETGLPCKEDIDRLISWGYFNVHAHEMTQEWQQRELAKCYAMIKDRHGMEPGPPCKQKLRPVQLTLEPLDIRYRPLLVYIICFLCKAIAAGILYYNGFSYHVTSTGVPYWVRTRKSCYKSNTRIYHHQQQQEQQQLPLLFFHGIAPGGYTFYLPMILWGLAYEAKTNELDRPIFFFENPAPTFALTDHAPTEQETTDGVWEAVDKHCSSTTEVCTVGHSFGTCLQTYLLHSSQSHRMRQMVLVDPVSIMLSDPDVITNFVYVKSHVRGAKLHDSVPNPGSAGYVMNELFIEHFLKRQFAWYNGELFLEDIPEHCQVIVCLSDKDEIVNPQKVKAHIDIYNGDTPTLPRCMKHLKPESSNGATGGPTTSSRVNPTIHKGNSTISSTSCSSTRSLESSKRSHNNRVDVIYWEGVGHGSCLFDPETWQQIRQRMQQQVGTMWKKKAS